MKPDGTTLWAKDLPLDVAIHRFTVGDDPDTDLTLLPWDALGSAAHAKMLAATGLLDSADAAALVRGLKRIANLAKQNAFPIPPHLEDGHTAIEADLTRSLGPVGQRIHLARSRNDQVILAFRLYLRDALLRLGLRVSDLAAAFLAFARDHQHVALPGYTHLRRAMPSTFGMWAAAFAEGLLEELEALQSVYQRLDRCPLGSAAGFGVPLPIDRALTAKLLGFSKVQCSPIDVQNSRGRHETALLQWAASTGGVLEKFLWDVSFYSTEEFGFLKLPDAFTTGSSIMPQKKNPDVVELARGRCRELRGTAGLVDQIGSGLPSSYHRDLQLLKRPVIMGLRQADELFGVLVRLIPALKVNAEATSAASTDELYAAHQAYVYVQGGLPFREAYRKVAQQIQEGTFAPDRAALTATHLGGAGNLGLDDLATELMQARAWIEAKRDIHAEAEVALWAN
ncbi:argininosuccinate lyase [Geothrix sp. PMB-07]|uniref:argininosuccinate lyase n=1 Tax=Geothrix sp. PMB-07 TaxID=3068640 RepID=UPI0027428E19|nr:argininosuccinate lyase [Geothrix sp. PMB-07]WLT31436.1 argininosuccinate lyase [Geothrix sp. PMB-07]